MKLEDQVVSLELAKKLKELGVKQESLFWWRHVYVTDAGETIDAGWQVMENSQRSSIEQVSAFTVAELGEMLPNHEFTYQPSTTNGPEEWDMVGIRIHHEHEDNKWISYFDTDTYYPGLEDHEPFRASTEADARAKMLIYLLENNLITL